MRAPVVMLLICFGVTGSAVAQTTCPDTHPYYCSNAGGYCCPSEAPYCTSDGDCSTGESGGGGECPSTHPYYCSNAGGYCCPSEAPYCTSDGDCGTGEGGGGGGGECPDTHPYHCENAGGYCCPSEAPYCTSDGDCGTGEGGSDEATTCPDTHPYYCENGDYCCPSEAPYCTNDGQCATGQSAGSSEQTCPSAYPYYCSNEGGYCCPSTHPYCSEDGGCLADSATCPGEAPFYCANAGGFCCPNTAPFCSAEGTCAADPSLDTAHGASDPVPVGANEGAVCASQSPAYVGATGHCTIDYCVESADAFCSSNYYVVNGERLECAGCGAGELDGCLNAVIETCTGERAHAQVDRTVVQPFRSSPSPTADSVSDVSPNDATEVADESNDSAVTDDSSEPELNCCTAYNNCGWDNDGACDCGGAYAWDDNDCYQGPNADSSSDEESDGLCSVGQVGSARTLGGIWFVCAMALATASRLRRKARHASDID